MKRTLPRLLATLLCLALLFAMAACGAPDNTQSTPVSDSGSASTEPVQTADTSTPTYGGTMTMYYHEFYNYYDPAMPTSYSYAFWLEGLWAMDWDSDYAYNNDYWTYENVDGQIADTWEIAEDYSSLTVHLREDVYFQSKEDAQYDIFGGRQLMASDVKYTYDRILGLGSGWDEPVECEMNWPSELYMVESVETDGDFTVIFHFNTTTEVALNTFMTTVVNITGPEWDELTADQQGDWHYAVGTGPFILTNVSVGSSMSFTRNDSYYDYDERNPENKLPYLDGVELVHIDDSANLLSQFTAGTIDWIGSTSAVFNSSELAQLRATVPEDSYTEYTYNTNPPAEISLKCNQEPFNDVRVRKALQMAINCDEIYHSYYGLEGEVIIPGIWATDLTNYSAVADWSDELKAEYSYDPEGARALLAEAGYPDGFTFTVALAPNADTDLYVLVGTYLADIGVTMEIEQCAEIMETISISSNPDDTRQVSGMHGGKGAIAIIKMTTTSAGANYTYNHGNQAYEDAVTGFEQAQTLDEQSQYAKEMDLIFAQEHWGIALGGYTQLNEFMSNKIHGYDGQKLPVNQYRRTVVARLWMDAE